MVSTTYVQFLKGFLLVFFAGLMVWMLLARGFEAKQGGSDGYAFTTVGPIAQADYDAALLELAEKFEGRVLPAEGAWQAQPFVRVQVERVCQASLSCFAVRKPKKASTFVKPK